MYRIRLGFLALLLGLAVVLGHGTRGAIVEAADQPVIAVLIGGYSGGQITRTSLLTFDVTPLVVTSGYQVRGDIPDLRTVNFNDKAIAVRVLSGTAIAAYSDVNYGGTCETLFGTHEINLTNSMVGKNDISSVKVNATCRGATSGKPILTSLGAVSGDSPNLRCGNGETRLNQDLNQSVGGKYVFLCATYGPSTAASGIRDVRVIGPYSGKTCCDSDLQPVSAACAGTDTLLPQDLNEGVSGYGYVYLCTSHFPPTSSSSKPVREISVISINHILNITEINNYCAAALNVPAEDVEGEITDLNEPMFSTHRPPLNLYFCKSTYSGTKGATPAGDTTPPAITVAAVNMPANCGVFCIPQTVAPGSTVTAAGTVTVQFSCSDGSTTLTPVPMPRSTYSTNGSYSITNLCTDAWGNQASATFKFVRAVP